MESKPMVFVVDDDSTTREGLRTLLESTGFDVRAFGSAEDFLAGGTPTSPGCLILDVCLPGISGPDLQRELIKRDIDLPILMVTGFPRVSVAVQAVKNGAIEFLEKPVEPDVLIARVRDAVAACAARWDEHRDVAELRRRLALLSRRQREVMDRVVNGQSSKGIAADLGLSPKTVEAHRARLMAKLQADSLAALVRVAMLAAPSAPSKQNGRE